MSNRVEEQGVVLGSNEILPVSPLQEKYSEVILTKSLLEILPDVIAGAKIREIARRHLATEGAIRQRIRLIFQAFGVGHRFDLISIAATDGLHYRCGRGPRGAFHLRVTIDQRKY